MTFSPGEKREVEAVLAEFRPDVVHLHNVYPSFGPAVHLAAASRGVPLAMTVHNYRLRCPNGFMFTEGAPCRRCENGNYMNAVVHNCFESQTQAAGYASSLWAHRFVLRLENKVSLFITPSSFLKSRMIQWGFPRDRLRVIRNFTTAPAASSMPGTFGMYLGRLSSEKGLEILLHALRAAGDPPFRFVGDGPVLKSLQLLAGRLELANTQFLGRLAHQDAASMLVGARFLVFASQWDENAPLAALEAMAAGRPLLVTDKGGLPELVANGEGLICRAGDASDIGEKIAALVRDEELIVAMAARGVARARAEFTPETHLQQLENAYRNILARS